ncbi:hypothetical protein ACFLZJ_00100 [Nanoarchaeota archaeon]
MDKRGRLLIENIVFIILNLVFLTIIVLFILKQGSGAVVLEQTYAKQIALLIDSAQPGMTLKLDMEKARKTAERNGIDFEKGSVININENVVTVKLSSKGHYSYTFFNDVDVRAYPDYDKDQYIFNVNRYKN